MPSEFADGVPAQPGVNNMGESTLQYLGLKDHMHRCMASAEKKKITVTLECIFITFTL